MAWRLARARPRARGSIFRLATLPSWPFRPLLRLRYATDGKRVLDLGLAILLLACLHIAAALYHWLIRKDGVMARMSLFRR